MVVKKFHKIKKKIQNQGKRIRTPLFKKSNSYFPDVQELLDEIDLEREQELEKEIEQSQQEIDRLKEIPEIRPNIKKGEQKEKEVVINKTIVDDYFDIKKCPVCNSRTKRKKVIKTENILRQYVKCKKCNWEKEIIEII